MDTKQRNRTTQARSRNTAQPQSGKSRSSRPQQTAKPAQRRSAPPVTARQPQAKTQQRSQSVPQQTQRTALETHNIVQQNAYAPHQMQVQEQVFKTEQKKKRVMNPEAAKRAEQRRKSAQRAKERKAEEAKKKKRPAVTYTQPVPINLNQMLLRLCVVVAVVLAVTMGLSVFFKVERVIVHGNKAYSAWTVQEAGGIENGSNLLSLNNARACGKIKAALPYVDTVRIGIKLPDTVNIYVEEIDIAYAITTSDGTNWLMTSEGKIVEQIDGGTANSYTKVQGVYLDSPVAGQQARALEAIQGTEPPADGATEETAPVIVTAAAKLSAALTILQQLEANDIVGEAASVDVSSLSNIELWYGQRFQVKLGDAYNMDIKINWMKSAVNQLSDYDMGVLDVSFTTWPDRVGYTPFAD